MVDDFNPDNFCQNKLVPSKQSLIVYNEDDGEEFKSIRIDGYRLPGYESFDIRQFFDKWVLSVAGRMVTYGSYDHVIDIIMLLVTIFKCWDSKTSLIYFLQLPEHTKTIKKILKLRNFDQIQVEVTNVN